MSTSLTYCYLPNEIQKWPGLPLSLSGEEIMPLDYRAGDSGWLLYGRGLNKQRISHFQQRSGSAIVIVSSWRIDDYQVVRIAGSLSAKIKKIAEECSLDVVPLGNIPRLRAPGLLVMDMDSTAIQIECIDEIARLAGVGKQVAEITERAMQGEIDFSESLKARVKLLAGTDIQILQNVLTHMPLTPGLTSLVRKLQAFDWHVVIVSGGFNFFTNYLKEKLKLTAAVANKLEIKDNKLTGKVHGNIVDAKVKAQTLIKLARQYSIPIEQTVAIGDGANDVKMIRKAGLGIAYHAKSKVQARAKVAIQHGDLMGVLCVLSGGLKHEER
ncbi:MULTISPECIES: phosphoserine phosphatase [Arsenophonus]|jgi:phosphoserine phosphatase|uniref:phosphoserine phosphatase n=1 Tax=Arsenophonus TaxID=637 RepID=UPI0015D6B255|nr:MULTISPECIES: phosphoserine phosphatase [Arsenophonus]UBX28700.1 phosphoserine phosphatase [Arsenophonus apicola]